MSNIQILIDNIFCNNLEVYLRESIRKSKKLYRDNLEGFDGHSLLVYNMAMQHLDIILEYHGARGSYIDDPSYLNKGRMTNGQYWQGNDPEFFEAWVLFGCPGVAPDELQRIERECKPAPRSIKPYRTEPNHDRFLDPHADRQVILSILDSVGPAVLRDFIRFDRNSGMPACEHRLDPYSRHILALALSHLDDLAAISDKNEHQPLRYARHFNAWMIGQTPGFRNWDIDFEGSSLAGF